MASRKLKQLGRYRIQAELGRGAMGVVYKAHDPVLDRTVALKTIALDDTEQDREEYQARFFQEAKAAARLNHPSLITIYDFGEESALAYMAMELLNGSELSERMAQSSIPISEAVAIAEQVAEGLAFAHDSGVIHRDIKPSNVMLLPRGRVKIMDFGIARLKVSDIKTQLGMRLGTPKYMSPEQIGGSKLDQRTDIFSLGIVLYEMLTGVKLFKGDTLTQVMHNVANFEPPPPSQINSQVPPLLDLVVKRAMEKKPSARYASAWEMVDDLRHCLQELAPSTITLQRTVDISEDESFADTANKTIALKPSSAKKPAQRRMSAVVETDSRLTLSRRFDSDQAMARLQAPTPRDRKQLSRSPRSPGLLRRLRHDRDFIWFTLILGLSLLIAGALALS
ncbi:MAG: serine/threonine protein kinase [Gallionella sp.]|nr:serine/threonine protein kinase [Gallionella sp.]